VTPPLDRFRTRLVVAMMLVVSLAALATLVFTERSLAANSRREFEQGFERELASLAAVRDARQAALAERCRALARKPRIHAALEDGALDLLYPSARDELVGVTGSGGIHALYYRFLDAKGAVIAPPVSGEAGDLPPAAERGLALPRLPAGFETGYLRRLDAGGAWVTDEVAAMPIVSSETGESISAVVLGFRNEAPAAPGGGGLTLSGTWLAGALDLPALEGGDRSEAERLLERKTPAASEGEFELGQGPGRALAFYKRLNPGSLYPPAYEVSVHPLADLSARQRALALEFGGAWALVLIAAFGASRFLSVRLSAPVERLEVDSERNRAERERAEAALAVKAKDLERSERFSADASHQLKTPVTVLRAGLEGLLSGEQLGPEARQEVSGLVHQTYRLAGVIDDLLLLSRMDAGGLKIHFESVDISRLLHGLIDDLGALQDTVGLEIDAEVPPDLWAEGERRFTALILENLLENARKYNWLGGRIGVTARAEDPWIVVTVGNTGPKIPEAAWEHIFERFHRGGVGEDVPGHGIGLNLARELARLHGGDLRLTLSDGAWTAFELRLREAPRP
jgi:signal transduction histidine kinase